MTDATTRGRRPGVDRMQTKQTGARTGSRPKPPEAGAQSASLEPGRAPGYSSNKNHSCSPRWGEGEYASLKLYLPGVPLSAVTGGGAP